MDIPVLEAMPREESGGHACRKLRRHDLVPAILYGRGEPNVMLAVPKRPMEKMVQEHHFIMRVQWGDESTPVQLKEIQYEALGDEIIHVDMGRISLSETVEVSVPIETHGEAAGVREGGVLELILHEVDVECLPTKIPEKLVAEVTQLNIGDDLRVRDLAVPEGVKILSEEDTVVALVSQPTEAEEEEPAEGEMAEPEVLGRAEKETEGEEAAEEQ